MRRDLSPPEILSADVPGVEIQGRVYRVCLSDDIRHEGVPSDFLVDTTDTTITIAKDRDVGRMFRAAVRAGIVAEQMESESFMCPAALGYLPATPTVRVVDGRMMCPYCPKGYLYGLPFANHLRNEHLDHDLAAKVKGRRSRTPPDVRDYTPTAEGVTLFVMHRLHVSRKAAKRIVLHVLHAFWPEIEEIANRAAAKPTRRRRTT